MIRVVTVEIGWFCFVFWFAFLGHFGGIFVDRKKSLILNIVCNFAVNCDMLFICSF